MLHSLASGISGLQNLQSRLNVIGNNVANANTAGYKSSRLDLAEGFAQTLSQASGSGGSAQIGSGVTSAGIRTQYEQGTIASTGVESQLAISGEGFFQVVDSTSGAQYVTRAGEFSRDSTGYLINPQGYRVQGFTNSALSARGDVQIPAQTDSGTLTGFAIGTDGRITAQYGSGTRQVCGQVLLQAVANQDELTRIGMNLFSLSSTSTASVTQAPGTGGLGTIQSQSLEMSNVDLTEQFADLITTQRGFQASARIVTTSDEVLMEVINLKR